MTRILFQVIIYLSCENVLENGRVKSKTVLNYFNFPFGQGSCLISDFARPNSNKVVLAQDLK